MYLFSETEICLAMGSITHPMFSLVPTNNSSVLTKAGVIAMKIHAATALGQEDTWKKANGSNQRGYFCESKTSRTTRR